MLSLWVFFFTVLQLRLSTLTFQFVNHFPVIIWKYKSCIISIIVGSNLGTCLVPPIPAWCLPYLPGASWPFSDHYSQWWLDRQIGHHSLLTPYCAMCIEPLSLSQALREDRHVSSLLRSNLRLGRSQLTLPGIWLFKLFYLSLFI